MIDFRALCAELLDEFVYHTDWSDAEELKDRARAALADEPAVPQPQPLAEGEVAELVAELQMMASQAAEACQFTDAENLSRAADLLQRGQSALHRLHRLQQENARFREPERTILCDILANGTLLPDPDGKRYGVQPVPVSERLPGAEDCDAEGRYWGLINGCEAWVLGKGSPSTLNITHWLPAHALPLPGQEVR